MASIKVVNQNQGNWLRLVVLIDYAGLKMCKEVLHTKEDLPVDGRQLYHKLLPFKNEMLYDDEKEILCPPTGVTDESKFDITLYIQLIKKMFGGRYDLLVSDFRKNRNNIYHIPNNDISDSDFEKEWTSTCDMLQRHGFNEIAEDLKTGSLPKLSKSEKLSKSIESLIKGSV